VVAGRQFGDRFDQCACGSGVAEFVDELHIKPLKRSRSS
jgi:hypothetical protein